MTRYIKVFSWPSNIEVMLRTVVKERPILTVCCGDSPFGDVRLDKENVSCFFPPDVMGDMSELPFDDDAFGCVFCDPPWDASYKKKCADYCKEALRVAPVCYLMAPWVWGSSAAPLTDCWVRQQPGINNVVVISRYERLRDKEAP